MGVRRDQLLRELQLRRYAPATQKAYLEAVIGLTKHFRIAPDQLSARQVQDYLLHLMLERQLHWNTVNTICSGLTFFYSQTLKRPDVAMAMPLRRTPRQRPEIVSGKELESLVAAVDNLQDRALLTSRPSCTPGTRNCCTTSICTASSPAAPWPGTAVAGCRRNPTTCSLSGNCRAPSAATSSKACSAPSNAMNSSSQAG